MNYSSRAGGEAGGIGQGKGDREIPTNPRKDHSAFEMHTTDRFMQATTGFSVTGPLLYVLWPKEQMDCDWCWEAGRINLSIPNPTHRSGLSAQKISSEFYHLMLTMYRSHSI